MTAWWSLANPVVFSIWNPVSIADMNAMFAGSVSYNQSLCSWGSSIKNTTKTNNMFVNTPCPFSNNRPVFSYSPPGPFCHDCCCRPSLMAMAKGPYEVPLVPVAVANLPDGQILAWSAQSRYRYGGEPEPMGTYTTEFDPNTCTSTLRRVIGAFCVHSRQRILSLTLSHSFPALWILK